MKTFLSALVLTGHTSVSNLQRAPTNPEHGDELVSPNRKVGSACWGPPVTDRVIQQAIAHVLTPVCDPEFSESSVGFRPQRSAHGALRQVQGHIEAGCRIAVKIDWAKFLDNVSHDVLLARMVRDKGLLGLVGRYVRAGVMGGDHRGSAARDADDFLIFVRSQRAAERVVRSISRFIEGHVRRRINPSKTKAARLSACPFLGFELRRGTLRWTDAAVKRFKKRVREITTRSNGRNMPVRIEALRRYVSGWLNSFSSSRSSAEVVALDQWLRRRVRLCDWKQWKRPRTRRRHLLALGIPRDEVTLATRSRKGYWRMAGNSIVQRALTTQWLGDQGVPNMRQQWIGLPYGASAP